MIVLLIRKENTQTAIMQQTKYSKSGHCKRIQEVPFPKERFLTCLSAYERTITGLKVTFINLPLYQSSNYNEIWLSLKSIHRYLGHSIFLNQTHSHSAFPGNSPPESLNSPKSYKESPEILRGWSFRYSIGSKCIVSLITQAKYKYLSLIGHGIEAIEIDLLLQWWTKQMEIKKVHGNISHWMANNNKF